MSLYWAPAGTPPPTTPRAVCRRCGYPVRILAGRWVHRTEHPVMERHAADPKVAR